MSFSNVRIKQTDLEKLRSLYPGMGNSHALREMIRDQDKPALSMPKQQQIFDDTKARMDLEVRRVNTLKRLAFMVGVDQLRKAIYEGHFSIEDMASLKADVMPNGDLQIAVGDEKQMNVPSALFNDTGEILAGYGPEES